METDRETYEKARMLKEYIANIRAAYTRDFTSEDEVKQQKAVATYLIDKVGLRSGTEKNFGTTVFYGCCAIKVENVRAIPPSSLEFVFQIKDITSKITLEVELPVYKAILQLRTGKYEDDYLFDKLDTTKLNTHLNELMPGLTFEVFCIYNTSVTLENMLNKENIEGDLSDINKVFSHAYNQVSPVIHSNATTCTTVMGVMRHNARQIDKLQGTLEQLKKDLANAEEGKLLKDAEEERELTELPEWKIARTAFSIRQLKRRMEEGPRPYPLTSMIEYCYDPRIAVAWCRRNGVPVEETIPTVRLTQCAWALDVGPDFRF
ncbi:PREDICTED: DNA topoisomerase 1-like [Fragaria vesca subsp. vesca]|uniref:DNA topoisomerase 1-like n=1 Tax=Fragaria vesca subsp. vesca TaxID=101020 RepID=UPI0002C35B5A|nr:PREDICTED: DNA topoisomerase 1-like [Fragaria vesca subsp. vesca]